MRLTRVSARCALWIGDGILVHLDPISREKRPAAWWWFGGSVAGTPEIVAYLKKEFGAVSFEGELRRRDDDPCDLSFWLPCKSWDRFEEWLNKEQLNLDIVGTAKNEIDQEFPDMELPAHLAEAVRYGETFKRFDVKGILHTYRGEKVKNAICYTYIVRCEMSSSAKREIIGLVDRSEDLYLISRADVKRRWIWGTVNGNRTKILVPKALRLLFR